MYDTIQQRCRRLGLEVNLTRDWMLGKLVAGRCSVTGIPFSFERGKGAGVRNKYGPSIDRIDSSRGYMQDNCQMVIYQYNVAKGSWTDEDVITLARALVLRDTDAE